MMKTSYRLAALVCLLGIGCGASAPGSAWQARVPVLISVAADVPADRQAVAASLSAGLAQFGFVTSAESWGQTINVVYDPACHCSSCYTGQTQNPATTAAYVAQAGFRTIHLCPAFARVAADFGEPVAIDLVVKHELGHVLGLVEHLEPAPGVLMSAWIDRRPTVRVFGSADIARICAAGGIHSPACD